MTLLLAFACMIAQVPVAPIAGQEVGPARQGGVLPRDFLRDNTPAKTPIGIWTAAEGDFPLATPDPKSRPAVASKPFKFMEHYYVAQETEDHKSMLLALPESGGRIRLIGWARADRLVTQTTAERNEATHVARKIIVVDTPKSLARTGGKGTAYSIVPNHTPDANRPIPAGRNAEIPKVYFRYREANGFVLIGTAPAFDGSMTATPKAKDTRPEEVVLGWIPGDMTIPFDGQIAAEWNKVALPEKAKSGDSTPGTMFQSPEEAYADGRSPHC